MANNTVNNANDNKIERDIFTVLNAVDVNDYVETKNTGKASLKYLSWADAWQEVRKRYPAATYNVWLNGSGLPYFCDPELGIMVFTTVQINEEQHDMWLPVMDGANYALKTVPYEVTTKFGTKTIEAATMFDVNKAIMRCLAKNLAMFGLGLYIYRGEDFPEEPEDLKNAVADMLPKIEAEIKRAVDKLSIDTQEKKRDFAAKYIVPSIGNANYKVCKDAAKLQNLLTVLQGL